MQLEARGPGPKPGVFSATSAPAWRSLTALPPPGRREPSCAGWETRERGRQLSPGSDVSLSCAFISVQDGKCLHADTAGVWLRVQILEPGNPRGIPAPSEVPGLGRRVKTPRPKLISPVPSSSLSKVLVAPDADTLREQ